MEDAGGVLRPGARRALRSRPRFCDVPSVGNKGPSALLVSEPTSAAVNPFLTLPRCLRRFGLCLSKRNTGVPACLASMRKSAATITHSRPEKRKESDVFCDFPASHFRHWTLASAKGWHSRRYSKTPARGVMGDAYCAEQAAPSLTRIIQGNCLETHCPVESFSCIYLNPPYDWRWRGNSRTRVFR